VLQSYAQNVYFTRGQYIDNIVISTAAKIRSNWSQQT